jgi:hypothetical protein
MLFSDAFKVQRDKHDTWFNPVLSLDTALFVDPFLIYSQERKDPYFAGSHKEVVGFFEDVFKLIARSRGNSHSVFYRNAVDRLLLPEVEELCLGYTGGGTGGLGSGPELAASIAAAIWEAIEVGMNRIEHFEEISILRSGIGPDRISDATTGILRHRLVRYTETICEKYEIKTRRVLYHRGRYDAREHLWKPIEGNLPLSPSSGKPILLVPERFLRTLPTINAEDFWNYCVIEHDAVVREAFNFDISQRVSKEDIIKLAREHPELRRAYVEDIEERAPSPYDSEADKKGLVRWYPGTKSFCNDNPLLLGFGTLPEFLASISDLVSAFKHFVEENAGWKLMWNDDGSPKGENAAQLLFLGIVKHYCAAQNIDISKEANIGRGPVDFKASHGHAMRALLELKLAKNTKFWNGLSKQLPTYQKAEGIRDGHFIVIVFNQKDLERLKDIQSVVKELNRGCPYKAKVTIIDARPEKPSASKL